jgi:putative Mg2+ transporter-C (MgtC) family protein
MDIFESFNKLYSVEIDLILKFLVAVLCGGAIGMERELGGKSAGLRTSIIVCVGSMLFTVISFQMATKFGGDPTRIAAQIVTGIGFLGAGAILHERGRGITGLTTAAMIWLMSAIGVMIGSGSLVSAMVITMAGVFALLALKRIEKLIDRRRRHTYTITFPDTPLLRNRIQTLMTIYGQSITDVHIVNDGGSEIEVKLCYLGSENERNEFLGELAGLDGLRLVGDTTYNL